MALEPNRFNILGDSEDESRSGEEEVVTGEQDAPTKDHINNSNNNNNSLNESWGSGQFHTVQRKHHHGGVNSSSSSSTGRGGYNNASHGGARYGGGGGGGVPSRYSGAGRSASYSGQRYTGGRDARGSLLGERHGTARWTASGGGMMQDHHHHHHHGNNKYNHHHMDGDPNNNSNNNNNNLPHMPSHYHHHHHNNSNNNNHHSSTNTTFHGVNDDLEDDAPPIPPVLHCEASHSGTPEVMTCTPLQTEFAFWYTRKYANSVKSHRNYEQNMELVGRFETVEQFWATYAHMSHAGDLRKWRAYNLFRGGVKPMWEDGANREGGKWAIRLRKGIASRLWENLVLAFIGEQFRECGMDEVTGIVMSIRQREDVLSIWNSHADDRDATRKIRDVVKRVLMLPASTVMTYKRHDALMRTAGTSEYHNHHQASEAETNNNEFNYR
eukprot:Nk52_evm5s207 gene=Nk52_evmTU5s207